MKKPFFFTIVFTCLLSVVTVFGQNKPYALQIVKDLGSPEMHGRGYVKKGDRKAAEYIKAGFEQHGVEPLTDQYFQYFNFNINIQPSTMSLLLGNDELVPGEDYLITPSSPSVKGNYRVKVLRKEDMLDPNIWQPIVKSSLKHFVIIDNRSEGWTDVEKEAVGEVINLFKNQTHPAMGCIELTNAKLTWYPATKPSPKPYFMISKEVDLSTIERVGVNVKSKFITGYRSQNVVGIIKGTRKPDSLVVFTAHYDHLGRMGKDTYFPGANDNASGVAMLLTMAEYYAANPPEYSIVLIAFGGEEAGLLGSIHFIKNPLIDLKKVRFLVNFDISGTGDDGIQVVNGSVYQNEFDQLVAINKENEYLPEIRIRGEACNSDHCLFHKKGVPCFFIYTLGGIQAYHDIYDKPETLPLTGYEGYFKLMTSFVEQLQR